MGIARELVRLEAALRGSSDVDLFGLAQEGGLLDSPEAGAMLRRLRRLDVSDPLRIMRLCLQALRVQYTSLKPRMVEAELVATLPYAMPGLACPTDQVLRRMLRPGIKEVILLGYQVKDEGIVSLLAKAADGGAEVFVICDRKENASDSALAAWPDSSPRPRVFEDRKLKNGAPYAKMHAKCILVDGEDLLVTSANFTYHGLHGNVEIGLRVRGQPAVEARKIFSYLVDRRIVEEKT